LGHRNNSTVPYGRTTAGTSSDRGTIQTSCFGQEGHSVSARAMRPPRTSTAWVAPTLPPTEESANQVSTCFLSLASQTSRFITNGKRRAICATEENSGGPSGHRNALGKANQSSIFSRKSRPAPCWSIRNPCQDQDIGPVLCRYPCRRLGTCRLRPSEGKELAARNLDT
jgi:hypothetical protein